MRGDYFLLGTDKSGHSKVHKDNLSEIISKISPDKHLTVVYPEDQVMLEYYPTLYDAKGDYILCHTNHGIMIASLDSRELPFKGSDLNHRYISDDPNVKVSFKSVSEVSHILGEYEALLDGFEYGISIDNGDVIISFNNKADFMQWKLSQ